MDIAWWLRGRGLGQYEPAFRDNDIDGAVLPSLTTEDLKGLGIASVGHRRRLLEAIAAPREGDEPTRPTAVAAAAPSRLVMAGDRGSRAGKALEAGQEIYGRLDARRASFETPPSRPPQDEELSQLYRSRILIMRSAQRARLE
jgi:hypothetical protein